MNWETYAALGDSITIGARTYLGYPEAAGNILSAHLSKQWNVINHSVCGYKAIDLARHIDRHFCMLKECNPSVTTILIGTNDIKEHTSPEEYRMALDQVIVKARLFTMNENVVLLTIPHFPKGVCYPYRMEMNEDIVKLNAEVRLLAAQHHSRLLELSHDEADFTDGVHLSNKGVRTFAQQVSAFILNDKGVLLESGVAAAGGNAQGFPQGIVVSVAGMVE
jgi:lysophospholipase L1-like esterase